MLVRILLSCLMNSIESKMPGQPSILVSRFIMNLRDAWNPQDSTTTTTDNKNASAPSGVVFAVRPSMIGNIGESLEHGRYTASMGGEISWESEIGEGISRIGRDSNEEVGMIDDIPLNVVRIEPMQERTVEASVSG